MLKRISNEFLTITDDCHIMQYHHTQSRELHEHGCFEMIYVLAGSAIHRVANQNGEITEHKLSIGNFFILDKHTAHGFKDVTSDFKIINFLFFPSLIADDLNESHSFEEMITHPSVGASIETVTAMPINVNMYDHDGRVHSLFANALSDYKSRAFGMKAMLRSCAVQILILAIRQFSTQGMRIEQTDDAIKQICKYVKEEYANHITLTELCERLHFNVSYMSKRFKLVYGTSFETYLQQTRIRKSCELLLVTNLSVSEISCQVGYSNTHSFRKIFCRIMRMTPSEFRKLYASSAKSEI